MSRVRILSPAPTISRSYPISYKIPKAACATPSQTQCALLCCTARLSGRRIDRTMEWVPIWPLSSVHCRRVSVFANWIRTPAIVSVACEPVTKSWLGLRRATRIATRSSRSSTTDAVTPALRLGRLPNGRRQPAALGGASLGINRSPADGPRLCDAWRSRLPVATLRSLVSPVHAAYQRLSNRFTAVAGWQAAIAPLSLLMPEPSIT